MKVKNGIDLPISGKPEQRIFASNPIKHYALRGVCDFLGLKPSMCVSVGDRVKLGQPLFYNKANSTPVYSAPVSGEVIRINRGRRRALESVVIRSDGKDTPFFTPKKIAPEASAQDILQHLLDSGHFTAFKTRPYSKVPDPKVKPQAIFVTAMDTNPLAVDARVVLAKKAKYFQAGVNAIAKLSEGKTFVCVGPNTELSDFAGNVDVKVFEGKHPAGNAGTHIHFLRPASATKTVWSIGYQDVINIGKLVVDGKLSYDRVISLAGPKVSNPHLIETRVGASIAELMGIDTVEAGGLRVINGSVLWGDTTRDTTAFLGRVATQISVIAAETDSRGLGWLLPWRDKFSSVFNVHLSSAFRNRLQNMDSGLNGSYRAVISIGHFEKLTPLDILPTQLMRAILVGDTDVAQKLGILELDEEDIALFAYADIGKNDFLGALRDCLTKIEKEG